MGPHSGLLVRPLLGKELRAAYWLEARAHPQHEARMFMHLWFFNSAKDTIKESYLH